MGRKGKWFTIGIQIIGILATFSSACSFAVQYYNECLPSKICVTSGQEETLSFGLPVTGIIRHKDSGDTAMAINLYEPITLVADSLTSYELELQLFGLFALKDVELEIVKEEYLIPAGIPIGIYLQTEGIMVVDVEEVEGSQGTYTPAKYILQKGDYILAVNGVNIHKKKELTEIIKHCNGESLIFTINRDNQVFDAKLTPVENAEGEYQLGIWVKDSAQGIGTLTYVDDLGSFGALGHGIHDSDTGNIVHLELGSLYETEIVAIKKGQSGEPGELTGVIDYNKSNILGDIYLNTSCGIFGNCNLKLMKELSGLQRIPVGYKQQVTVGPAEIVCTIDGERSYYDIEITALHYDAAVENKGLEIKVTDPELLELTGGIVQGMSGASIVQNGKVIGAVTHVLVRDSARGYGIFIEDMMKQ